MYFGLGENCLVVLAETLNTTIIVHCLVTYLISNLTWKNLTLTTESD